MISTFHNQLCMYFVMIFGILGAAFLYFFLKSTFGCVCAHTTVVFVRMPCLITSVEVTGSVMEILRPSEWPYSGLERITTTSPYLRLPPQPQSRRRSSG